MNAPKLRFPEFWEAGEWKTRELREFITERSQIPVDKLPLFSLTIEDGVTPKTERYERSFLVKNEKDAYKLVCQNDFAYNPMNLRFGAIGRHSGCQNVALSKYYNIFYCDETVDSIFCEIYFKSDGMLTHYDDVATGSLIEKRRVHFSNFLKIKIVFPSLSEQQKIAACLSSLDELITAQAQKVEALKTHKKGLMQQLFPATGETVPKLRFPEFLEAGEWVLEEFSRYIVLYRGSSPRPIQNYLTSDSSGVNWIKIGDTKYSENFVINQVEERITPEGAKKSRKVNVGELILANSMSYGKTYQVAITGCIYDGWFVLRDYEKHFDKQFLLQLLNSEYMQNQYERFSAGGIVQNISSEIVYKTVLPNTSLEEQQKIAACLSSLDELITAQAQKLEALKTHKKGLMQQLFPAANGTE